MPNELIAENKLAYQYFESINDRLQKIIKPLSALGIAYFGHLKIYNNGTFFHIINNADYQRDYLFTEGGFGDVFIGAYSRTKKKECFLTPYDKINTQKDRTIGLLSHNNVFNIFNMYENKGEYLSGYFFGTDHQGSEFPSFYINNTKTLEQFIKYFNEKEGDLIDVTDKNKMARFDQKFDFYNQSKKNLQNQQIEKFLQETYTKERDLRARKSEFFSSREEIEGIVHLALGEGIKQISSNLSIPSMLIEKSLQTFKHLNKPPLNATVYAEGNVLSSLSPRQKECLLLLTRGKTAKQIAQTLGISHRTVETHIISLKNKMNCTTKNELIDKVFDTHKVFLSYINNY